MSDLLLVLARLDEGVSCFLVPRVLPDGSRNVFHVQRLRDELGDRSDASSEVEFDGTTGRLAGDPGRGVPAIIEMVNMTRLDCVLGSAATVRVALTQAIHHARHRSAFGALLVDQPLMQNVLADLAVESEAAFLRLAGAAAKFRVCKPTPGVVAEAMEVLGGNGYVEDSGLPRLYRLVAELGDPDRPPLRARRIAGLLALCLQGSLLLRHAPAAVADAFCASRLGGDRGAVLGTLPASTDVPALVRRSAIGTPEWGPGTSRLLAPARGFLDPVQDDSVP